MKDVIKNKIVNYVLSSKDNWNVETNDRIYDEPIVKFASADDPLFGEYKTIIGEEHFTPREIYEKAFGMDSYLDFFMHKIIIRYVYCKLFLKYRI
jgi:hypothetical protein